MGSPVVWFEMHVPDVDVAKEFYGMLFGWQFSPTDDVDGDYWLISTSDGTVSGGLTLLETEPGDGIVLYVGVESLEGTVESAQLLGASIEQGPTVISDQAGSFALLRDPNGSLVGLWSREIVHGGAPGV